MKWSKDLWSKVVNRVGRWFLFEVVIPLAPLCLLFGAYYLYQKPWRWEDIVQDGSLLLFATTIASKAVGQHYDNLSSDGAKGLCITMLVMIVMQSTFTYALVVISSLTYEILLSPLRLARMSAMIATASLIFSIILNALTRTPGGDGFNAPNS